MKVPLDEGGTLLLRTWNTPQTPEGAQPDTTFSLLSFPGFLSSLGGDPRPTKSGYSVRAEGVTVGVGVESGGKSDRGEVSESVHELRRRADARN